MNQGTGLMQHPISAAPAEAQEPKPHLLCVLSLNGQAVVSARQSFRILFCSNCHLLRDFSLWFQQDPPFGQGDLWVSAQESSWWIMLVVACLVF